MTQPANDLSSLLDTLDPEASAVQRNLWWISLFDWIRGPRANDTHGCVTRLTLLLDVLHSRADTAARLQSVWRQTLDTVDASTLLSDCGFAAHSAFVSELVERLHRKVLPRTPETADATELFEQVWRSPDDGLWLQALPEDLVQRLAELLHVPCAQYPRISAWQHTVLEAITICTSQIRAVGFSPEVRLRMSRPSHDTSPFHHLAADWEALHSTWLQGGQADSALVQHFKARLEACRHAAASVYTHLDAHGISVELVFRLRQLRERVLRIRMLLDCLLDTRSQAASVRLLAHLAQVAREQHSVRALVRTNSSLLAAKVAERNSETGEHYITRTASEYRHMVQQAAGGGALTAVTTALKFGVMAVGFSAFWYGFWAGMVYAVSFVVIQLLHFTLATKQPAMTAPAMAAKLKDLEQSGGVENFVDEVTHLVRSQVAAVLGNVLAVFPAALALAALYQWVTGHPVISEAVAHYALHSLDLVGPSLLFAAFTGLLLFSSSILAGWAENWFVLHRLDSAIRYNPAFTRWLGTARALRWSQYLRANVSGFAANISLGFMLGLIPPVLQFVGIGLDVRHVTLSTGQLGMACAVLGWDVLRQPALWWALASLPFIAALNVGVSFYLAFRVALQAHNVEGIARRTLYAALRQRLRTAPLRFFWPARDPAP